MVLEKKDILEQVKGLIGENTDDASLKFLEDLTDTIDDLTTKAQGDGEDWKTKYEENDKEWRQKYHDRFFNGTPNDDKSEPKNDLTDPSEIDDNSEEDNKPKNFEDLFEEVK